MMSAEGLVQHHSAAHVISGDGNRKPSRFNLFARLRKRAAKARVREMLHRRLDELVILEITKEGGRQYYHFSVREFYNYCLRAITRHPLTSHSYSENVMMSWDETQQRRSRTSSEDSLAKEGTSQEPIVDPNKMNTPRQKPSRGRQRTATGNVTYRERLGGHLHPRDLRRLITPFSLSNEPKLIVRRHVILLNFDPLRAVILRDRLLVLVPDGADSLLETLERRVRGGVAGAEKDIFGDPSNHGPDVEKEPLLPTDDKDTLDVSGELGPSEVVGDFAVKQFCTDEIDELRQKTWIDLPFELQCLDAVLHGVAEMLAIQAHDVQKVTLSSMEYLLKEDTGVGDFTQDLLRTTKDNIHGMLSRVNGAIRALTEILNDDEDMALMNLTRLISHPERFIKPVPARVLKEESDEPELILEAYLQRTVTITNVLQSLDVQLHTTEELLHMKADTMRNRILFVNMIVAVFAMVLSMALLITGFFALNVPLDLYHKGGHGRYFLPVVFVSMLATGVVFAILIFLIGRIGILSAAV